MVLNKYLTSFLITISYKDNKLIMMLFDLDKLCND